MVMQGRSHARRWDAGLVLVLVQVLGIYGGGISTDRATSLVYPNQMCTGKESILVFLSCMFFDFDYFSLIRRRLGQS